MTKKEMIDKIYEVIADKTLTMGCKVNKNPNQYIVGSSGGYGYDVYEEFAMPPIKQGQEIGGYDGYYDEGIDDGKYKIIGHPVTLGSVLDRYEKLPHAQVYTDNSLVIVKAWKDKRKPIEEQPDTLIEYIYNLLP